MTKKISLLTFKKLFGALLVASLLFLPLFVGSEASAATCGKVETSFDLQCQGVDAAASNANNPIFHVLIIAVNFMAVAVGLVVLFFVIWGALTYTTSDGDSGKAQKGISYITNAILALILFLGMYAITNFLIPGGLFK